MIEEPRRYFTLEEANRTLPLVSRIVQDIAEAYPLFRQRLQELHERAAALGDADAPALRDMRRVVDARAEHINRCIAELRQVGCVFKGFDPGLVDFYSRHDGRTILLCWKLGEDRIAWWHEPEAGFAGRQPLTPDMRGEGGVAQEQTDA